VLIVLALSLIRISPFWIKDGFMLIPACAPLLAAIMSGLILSKRVRSPKWNTLPTNGCTGSPINPAPGEPFRWTLIFKDFINYMKIKFLKTFSIMLQILGVIFLILIITPLIINFYFSFDKQLQDFSWKVIKVSDSKEILYQVNENVVTLVFEGRRQLKVLNGDCGIHNFTYKIGYENSFRTDSYHLVKGCPLWSLESNTYYDVMHVLDRVHKYRIDGDTLWLESYGHGEIVLMRNKSKL
jgi:hypothetical protein